MQEASWEAVWDDLRFLDPQTTDRVGVFLENLQRAKALRETQEDSLRACGLANWDQACSGPRLRSDKKAELS